MSVTKENALKLWNDVFGSVTWAQDCFGTWMHKDDYGDTEKERIRPGNTEKYQYGWNVDHIKPLDADGPDTWNNYEPMQWHNNQVIKSNKTSFQKGKTSYQVVKCEICKKNNKTGYGIQNQSTGVRVDWKGVQKSYYK